MKKTFSIDSIAFIGRTLDEYMRMLDLSPEDLRGKRILDCPAGACSFAAEAAVMGAEVVAADVLYDMAAGPLERKCRDELEKVTSALRPVADQYRWDFYGSVEGLVERRVSAYKLFIKDYADTSNQEKYVKATMPELPFADNEFSLVLSAHFLFLYGDRLDYDFHLQALRELARVAREEVRVFPVLGLDSVVSPHLDGVMRDIVNDGLKVEQAEVPFEFQRGGNMMLRILK